MLRRASGATALAKVPPTPNQQTKYPISAETDTPMKLRSKRRMTTNESHVKRGTTPTRTATSAPRNLNRSKCAQLIFASAPTISTSAQMMNVNPSSRMGVFRRTSKTLDVTQRRGTFLAGTTCDQLPGPVCSRRNSQPGMRGHGRHRLCVDEVRVSRGQMPLPVRALPRARYWPRHSSSRVWPNLVKGSDRRPGQNRTGIRTA